MPQSRRMTFDSRGIGGGGMIEVSKILLADHLKTLKLPTFLREYEKLARQCATEGLDHVQFLARLVELELIDRERKIIERRIKAAKFPPRRALPPDTVTLLEASVLSVLSVRDQLQNVQRLIPRVELARGAREHD